MYESVFNTFTLVWLNIALAQEAPYDKLLKKLHVNIVYT